MNTAAYTPDVMKQTGQIYDKLEQLPPTERFIAKLVAEAFINGLTARNHAAQPTVQRPSA